MHRRLSGDNYIFVAASADDLGALSQERGDLARAEQHFREAVRIYRVNYDGRNLMLGNARIALGDVLRERGKLAEAESLLVGGYTTVRGRRMPGARFRHDSLALASLVKLYEAQGRESEAAKYRVLIDSISRSQRR